MEDMNKYVMRLMEKSSGEEDYMDEEGYLCCGKCHTRKECRATADFLRRYNKPREYADLVLNGGLREYIGGSFEHKLEN